MEEDATRGEIAELTRQMATLVMEPCHGFGKMGFENSSLTVLDEYPKYLHYTLLLNVENSREVEDVVVKSDAPNQHEEPEDQKIPIALQKAVMGTILPARNFGAVKTLKSLKFCLNCPSNCKIHMENNHKDNSRGGLIVLEGLDRSGKTSQSSRLLSHLEGQGLSVESWRFPDRTTCVGNMISSYLTNNSQLDDRTVHLLFSANRWEKRSLMESKLRSGTTLIVDRYSYSGVAFSSAKGLDIDWCKAPEAGLLAPDLVVYLDIPPEKAAERGGYGGERYEQLEFQKKVSQYYNVLCDPTWKIIDACLPVDVVEKQLKEFVMNSIAICQKGKPLSQLWSRS
ncbi:hypothetical protein GIB67_000591 [Kingdonia uniflora]|uniref:Thymidylate kinase n=1 Tax=Kingdonia uniflora TaxID=39325 RepID=A0A7J7P2L3_9MAGN|nr:hypothetical protein GIB67_000591 [Kingdonia uniflora]